MKKKAAYRSLFCLIVDWQSYFLYFWRLIISFMQIGETYEHTTNSSDLYCGPSSPTTLRSPSATTWRIIGWFGGILRT